MPFGSACASSPRGFDCGAGRGADGTPVYRPRHPERTAFYRLVHDRLDRYLGAYEGRFEPRHGLLRSVVPRAAEAFLECGRLQNGFARICLERDRRLLGLLSRCAYETLRRTWALGFGHPHPVPGMVASLQTFGSFANFHPHIHALVTNGIVTPDGEFLPLTHWTPRALEGVFRRLVLTRLVRAERLSAEFRDTLLGRVHSGSCVHGEQLVFDHETDRLERLARYALRAPFPSTASPSPKRDGSRWPPRRTLAPASSGSCSTPSTSSTPSHARSPSPDTIL